MHLQAPVNFRGDPKNHSGGMGKWDGEGGKPLSVWQWVVTTVVKGTQSCPRTLWRTPKNKPQNYPTKGQGIWGIHPPLLYPWITESCSVNVSALLASLSMGWVPWPEKVRRKRELSVPKRKLSVCKEIAHQPCRCLFRGPRGYGWGTGSIWLNVSSCGQVLYPLQHQHRCITKYCVDVWMDG